MYAAEVRLNYMLSKPWVTCHVRPFIVEVPAVAASSAISKRWPTKQD